MDAVICAPKKPDPAAESPSSAHPIFSTVQTVFPTSITTRGGGGVRTIGDNEERLRVTLASAVEEGGKGYGVQRGKRFGVRRSSEVYTVSRTVRDSTTV